LANELDLLTLRSLLIRIRKAKHLAQFDITTTTCTQGMVSKIETGKTSPSFIIVISILERLGVSLNEFQRLYLNELETKQDAVHQSLLQAIETYQFFLLEKYRHIVTLHPDHQLLLQWLRFCFNIQLTMPSTRSLSERERELVQRLFDQEEFFASDYYKIIYHLPFIALDSALYNYQRLLDEIKRHNVKYEHQFAAIDATMTLGMIFYAADDFDKAYHHLYLSLQKATQQENIPRMIICQISLSLLAGDDVFLAQAHKLSQLFSKDIFFNYWYNVLYSKFNEV